MTSPRTLFALAIVVLVGVGAYKHGLKAQQLSRLGTQTKTAFLRWRTQVLGEETPGRGAIPGLKRGDDIYRHYNYPNPPVMALILWPLMELPPVTGALAWYFLKVAMAAAALVWTFRLCGPMPDWAKVVAVLLSLHPILGDLSHGNVNIFIAFLILATLELLRRRLDGLAGLVLALAVACKVTPALFLPYLVWKGYWKTLIGFTAGAILWVLLVPGAVLGWDRNLTYLEGWYDGMVKPFVVDGKVTSEHANQSLPGMVFRLLTGQPSVVDYDENDQPFGADYHNLTDIGEPAARLLLRGSQVAFLVVMVWLCRARTREGPWFAAECGYIVLGMLLFSERTWKHHGVTLMLPFAVLTSVWATDRSRWALGILAAAGLLTVVPSLLPEGPQDLALTYGTHTAAFLLLTVGMGMVMWRERKRAAPIMTP
jgi:hypothetical protein